MIYLQRIFLLLLWNYVYCQNLNHGSQLKMSKLLPDNTLKKVITDALEQAERDILERERSIKTFKEHPSYFSSARHCLYQSRVSENNELESLQEKIEKATKILKNRHKMTVDEINAGLSQIDIQNVFKSGIVQNCTEFRNLDCDYQSRYRSADGACNNLKNPSWGMAASCYERLMDPVYADGISEVRLAQSGRDLPLPRRISTRIHSHKNYPSDHLTHMFMQWGQFLSHDIEHGPVQREPDFRPLNCCPVTEDNHPQCAPIIIEANDTFYSPLGIECLNNARSTICPTCTSGPRQQLNRVTSFIDGSLIYGNSVNEINSHRSKTDGLLITQANDLLPESTTPNSDACSFQMPTPKCFLSGDPRVNSQPALTSLHTVFLRHHNRLARKLKEINPNWEDESLFQEARKILGAQLEVISYNEYLPRVLGPEQMDSFQLNINNDDIYTFYNETAQPTILNEFSAAAFRFGHSEINSFFARISSQENSTIRLRDTYFWPYDLYKEGYVESLLRGMVNSPMQKFDRYIVPDMTNHLFQYRGNRSGLDLAAIDIYRGRDNGMPPYVDVVEFCGGPKITSFSALDQLFQSTYKEQFEDLYESVHDIDLFTGGLAERPMPQAVVGPTFACIIATQFQQLKYGDRFYFEHGNQTGSFTLEQIRELKKTSLAKIICDNTDINKIQRKAMEFSSQKNPEFPCDTLLEPNIEEWKDLTP